MVETDYLKPASIPWINWFIECGDIFAIVYVHDIVGEMLSISRQSEYLFDLIYANAVFEFNSKILQITMLKGQRDSFDKRVNMWR